MEQATFVWLYILRCLMNNKTQGAWVVSHSQKLKSVQNADNEFEQINFAGKCGVLLSSISADKQDTMSLERLKALSRAANVNIRTELPSILDELERQRLISRGSDAIEVLGMGSNSVLEHTYRIFEESEPENKEKASIVLAEQCSQIPMVESSAKEFIGDTFRIANNEVNTLFHNIDCIGLVDSEETYSNEKLLFNGNLFRGKDTKKLHSLVNSMSQEESVKINEINDLLSKEGCIDATKVRKILGEPLYAKAQSIGIFDVNAIGNESGQHEYVTKPSAFNKYSNSTVEDAFDLAKAFVTSLTYGMQSSSSNRGRIQMINALLAKLIRGEWIGPATAIGQDYKILELKGVVKVRPVSGSRCEMKLLKKEVGKLAQTVINEGDASTHYLESLPSAAVTSYSSPESNRQLTRHRQDAAMKRNVGELLNQLRTGNF